MEYNVNQAIENKGTVLTVFKALYPGLNNVQLSTLLSQFHYTKFNDEVVYHD